MAEMQKNTEEAYSGVVHTQPQLDPVCTVEVSSLGDLISPRNNELTQLGSGFIR